MKSAKNLLIPSIVLILLALTVGVFFIVDRYTKRHPVETTLNTVDLLYINPVDLASVSVFHKESNVTVRIDKKSAANGSDVYSYSGSDKGSDSYSQNEMASFVSELSSFVGCTPVSETATLSEFGLDSPAFTVTVTKLDGTSSVVLIGDLSPDREHCYLCIKGSAAVYMTEVIKYNCAARTANDFLDSRILDVEMSNVESVRFARKKDSIDISASCRYDENADTYTFRFNKPFEIDSSTYFDRLIEILCSLEASEYEDSSAENINRYGLNDPQFSVVIRLKSGQVQSFGFSSLVNGYYYGRLNGSGKIFKVVSGKLESIESPVLVLISEYIFYDTCDNIDSVECSGSGKSFELRLDVGKGKAISDDNSTVTLDGRNAKVNNSNGRSYAAMLYESIFCINIGGVDETDPVTEGVTPVTTIRIFDRNHSSVVYDFYKRSDSTCYVFRNGQYTKFYIFNRELYNDGGSDTYDYGIWPAYEMLTKAITNGINGVYDIPDAK